jgi:hypothetical protein
MRLSAPDKQRRTPRGCTGFVDVKIGKALNDLPFSGNKPLTSTDDKCIGILKNETKIFGILQTELKNKMKGI